MPIDAAMMIKESLLLFYSFSSICWWGWSRCHFLEQQLGSLAALSHSLFNFSWGRKGMWRLPHLAVPTPKASAQQSCKIILGTFLRRGFASNDCQLYSSFLNIPTSLLHLLIQEKTIGIFEPIILLLYYWIFNQSNRWPVTDAEQDWSRADLFFFLSLHFSSFLYLFFSLTLVFSSMHL